MKIIFIIIELFLISTIVFQNEITIERITNKYSLMTNDIVNLEKSIFRNDSEPGVSEEIKIYYKNGTIKLIKYHKYSSGLTSVDDHLFEELFYIDGKLVYIKTTTRIDYFDQGISDESTTSINEIQAYLDFNGNCIKYYHPRKIEGTRKLLNEMLNKLPLKDKDCMYCGYNGKEGDYYLNLTSKDAFEKQ